MAPAAARPRARRRARDPGPKRPSRRERGTGPFPSAAVRAASARRGYRRPRRAPGGRAWPAPGQDAASGGRARARGRARRDGAGKIRPRRGEVLRVRSRRLGPFTRIAPPLPGSPGPGSSRRALVRAVGGLVIADPFQSYFAAAAIDAVDQSVGFANSIRMRIH